MVLTPLAPTNPSPAMRFVEEARKAIEAPVMSVAEAVFAVRGVDRLERVRAPGQPITLPSDPSVRVPNHLDVEAGERRSTFKDAQGNATEIVPLLSTGMLQANQRTGQPTNVRVIMDKVEMYKPGGYANGALTTIGDPEKLTLVPGDRVSINMWGDNRTGKSVTQGLQLRTADGKLVDARDVFEPGSIRLTPPPPAKGPAVPVEQALRDGQNGVFGNVLSHKEYGGFTLTGTVRKDWKAGDTLTVQPAIVPTASMPGGKVPAKTAHLGVDADESIRGHLHQQGQFYGDYVGQAKLGRGEKMTIAAPGSYTYHGDQYKGAEDQNGKQAAYWVPIRVTLHPEGEPKPKTFQVQSYGDRATNANAIQMRYFDPRNPNSAVSVRPGQDVAFRPGWVLETQFLGGSATNIAVSAR